MAAASYEWAVSADGEDWSVVETEDDDTFGVTADLLGMYVKVTVTAEDGETASDVTTEKVAENEDFGVIEITSAEAIAANRIAITLANPVITTDTTITVTKGTNEIAVTASWADTFDSVSLTTPTNMSEGTYTVTLTSTEDPTNTDSATFEVEGQKVAQIVILNETALTNPAENPDDAHLEAYAYYDVLDQYGESVRTSASVQWSGSAKITANKATGQLTLTKNDGNAWVYNDKIYITGVYTKTGIAATAELTVGTEQALDSIEVAGFVKKNTTKLEKTLPADFKSGEWYLLFNAYDQNGNLINAGGLSDNDVTIISDNVLVVKEVKGVQEAPITIDDVDYNAILVQPGIKVADGGKVNLTAIATKTGNKTEYPCVVGVDQVIVSFTMGAPTATLADGETVEIPFIALDADGNAVTDFDTIAKQETFNALTFSVGGNGHLVLAEQDDGTAKLSYVDESVYWTDAEATNGIDRPVSLTAVVLGGASDNQMISVSDKARPDAIKAVDLDDVYVEGAAITLSLGDIEFYDQYGRDMGNFGDDNGFFGATSYAGSSDFNGYTFSVKATYSGNGGLYVLGDGEDQPAQFDADGNLENGTLMASNSGWVLANDNNIAADFGFGVVSGDDVAAVITTEDVVSSRSNEGFKFEIVKIKTSKLEGDHSINDFESTSRAKSKLFTVVDINAVKNFTVDDLGTLYLGADEDATGDGKIATAALNALHADGNTEFSNEATGGLVDTDDYQKAIVVTGTYNGNTVTIPANYYTATGNKVAATFDASGDWLVDTIISYDEDDAPGGLTIQDLYDKTTSQGVSKLASDTIKVTVRDVFGAIEYTPDDDVPDSIDAEVPALKAVDAVDTLTDAATKDDMLGDAVDYANGNTIGAAITAIEARMFDLDEIIEADGAAYSDAGAEGADLSEQAVEAAKEERANLLALGTALDALVSPNVVDTTSTTVSLSDQAPKATSFSGLADAYTIAPWDTEIGSFEWIETTLPVTIDTINTALKKVTVIDQYGVEVVGIDEVNRKASSVVESAFGYVDSNFSTTGNNTTALTITGAELGDTFTLGLSYQGVEASTAITVGADALATVSDLGNTYRDVLLVTLENQRKGILDIAG